MSLKVLILGVNGFIGSALTEAILKEKSWQIYGMDMGTDKIEGFLSDPRFHFVEGDITINKEWIEYHIKKCDVILPLVAIATPAIYVSDPLRVFELDFEANLEIVRKCAQYKKRVVFPSTSEVYGTAETEPMTEDHPLNPRSPYAAAKVGADRLVSRVLEIIRYFLPRFWVIENPLGLLRTREFMLPLEDFKQTTSYCLHGSPFSTHLFQ